MQKLRGLEGQTTLITCEGSATGGGACCMLHHMLHKLGWLTEAFATHLATKSLVRNPMPGEFLGGSKRLCAALKVARESFLRLVVVQVSVQMNFPFEGSIATRHNASKGPQWCVQPFVFVKAGTRREDLATLVAQPLLASAWLRPLCRG